MLRNRIKLICNCIQACINWLEVMFHYGNVALFDQLNNRSYPKNMPCIINFKYESKKTLTRLNTVLTILFHFNDIVTS